VTRYSEECNRLLVLTNGSLSEHDHVPKRLPDQYKRIIKAGVSHGYHETGLATTLYARALTTHDVQKRTVASDCGFTPSHRLQYVLLSPTFRK
jgi:hypothetical protein